MGLNLLIPFSLDPGKQIKYLTLLLLKLKGLGKRKTRWSKTRDEETGDYNQKKNEKTGQARKYEKISSEKVSFSSFIEPTHHSSLSFTVT
jgi:hypothetical protein